MLAITDRFFTYNSMVKFSGSGNSNPGSVTYTLCSLGKSFHLSLPPVPHL